MENESDGTLKVEVKCDYRIYCSSFRDNSELCSMKYDVTPLCFKPKGRWVEERELSDVRRPKTE